MFRQVYYQSLGIFSCKEQGSSYIKKENWHHYKYPCSLVAKDIECNKVYFLSWLFFLSVMTQALPHFSMKHILITKLPRDSSLLYSVSNLFKRFFKGSN